MVVVVLEADTFGDVGHVREHLGDLLCRNTLALAEEVGGRPIEVDRGIGRELERVVLHLDVAAKLGCSGLELTLTDVAPGALHV